MGDEISWTAEFNDAEQHSSTSNSRAELSLLSDRAAPSELFPVPHHPSYEQTIGLFLHVSRSPYVLDF
jgi:hypothetical protein